MSAAIEHNPHARTAAECRACDDPDAYGFRVFDHVAVHKSRPPDFDAQVRAMVEQVAHGAPSLAGVSLHPDAARRARRWLKEQNRRA